jgi:putative ABC transport system ATP-binding protein
MIPVHNHPRERAHRSPWVDDTLPYLAVRCPYIDQTELRVNNLLELTAVTKRYGENTQPALDNVTVTFTPGKITAILGPSGSGKSTLLNIVAGLDRPTSGGVCVGGVEITRLSESALARYRRTHIGLIFQFFNLLNNLTVLDNVLIPARLAGQRRGDALKRAGELLDQLGIAEEATRYPAALSGGQRQRVAIARAIMNRPPVLLADEPTGALDSHSGEGVIDMLRDLERTGQTILLVTHDARLAERCAHRIVTLVDGAIAGATAALEIAR